jgi:hypothetical protein
MKINRLDIQENMLLACRADGLWVSIPHQLYVAAPETYSQVEAELSEHSEELDLGLEDFNLSRLTPVQLQAFGKIFSKAVKIRLGRNQLENLNDEQLHALNGAFSEALSVVVGSDEIERLSNIQLGMLALAFPKVITLASHNIGLGTKIINLSTQRIQALGIVFPRVKTLGKKLFLSDFGSLPSDHVSAFSKAFPKIGEICFEPWSFGDNFDLLDQWQNFAGMFPQVHTVSMREFNFSLWSTDKVRELTAIFPRAVKFDLTGSFSLMYKSSKKLIAFIRCFPQANEIDLSYAGIQGRVTKSLLERQKESHFLAVKLLGLGKFGDEFNNAVAARRGEVLQEIKSAHFKLFNKMADKKIDCHVRKLIVQNMLGFSSKRAVTESHSVILLSRAREFFKQLPANKDKWKEGKVPEGIKQIGVLLNDDRLSEEERSEKIKAVAAANLLANEKTPGSGLVLAKAEKDPRAIFVFKRINKAPSFQHFLQSWVDRGLLPVENKSAGQSVVASVNNLGGGASK